MPKKHIISLAALMLACGPGQGIKAELPVIHDPLEQAMLKQIRHQIKGISEAELKKEVGEQILLYETRINDYSRYFSNLTRFDDFIEAGVRDSMFVSKSLAEANIIVESKGNLRAKSRAGAAGPSQFIEETALKEGIKIDNFVDYRHHPESITKGIKHLDDLITMFEGNEILGLVGYNAGKDWVYAVYEEFGLDPLWIQIKDFVPRETRNHIVRVLALKEIYENPEAHGLVIEQKPLFSQMIAKVHNVKYGENLYWISKRHKIPLKDVVRCNPQIKRPNLVGKGTQVYIPRR